MILNVTRHTIITESDKITFISAVAGNNVIDKWVY